MEHDRRDLTRPSSRWIRGSVVKSSGPPSNPGVLASGSQDGANAVPCAVDVGAHSRLAVQADARVTEELGTAEIEPGVSTQEAMIPLPGLKPPGGCQGRKADEPLQFLLACWNLCNPFGLLGQWLGVVTHP